MDWRHLGKQRGNRVNKLVETKKIAVFLAAFVLLACMSACGKKQVVYNELEEKEDVNSDENIKPTNGDEDSEKLEYEMVDAAGNRIVVSAEVDNRGKERAGAYGLTKTEIDDESIRLYAQNLFDNGEYTVIKPSWFSNEEELTKEKAFFELEAEKYEETDIPVAIVSFLTDIEYYLENQDDVTYIDGYEDQILYWDEKKQYGNGILKGTIDGSDWTLWINQGFRGGVSGTVDKKQMFEYLLQPYDARAFESTLYPMDVADENLCDEDTAREQAAAFLNTIGYENMEEISVFQIMPLEESNLNGYCFVYGLSIDGLQPFFADNCEAHVNDGPAAGQSYLYLYVDDRGVAELRFQENYQISAPISENAALMDFERINECARNEMVTLVEKYSGAEMTVTEVNLEYMAITYDGTEYVLVPAWVYYYETSSMAENDRNALFAVNALDGEIIDLQIPFGLNISNVSN